MGVLKDGLPAAMLMLGLSTMAWGQAEPSAIAPYTPGRTLSTLPNLDGSFQYALNASELIQTGYGGGGVTEATNLSGDVAYYSKSKATPFSLLYAGGVILGNQYGSSSLPFQSLSISQGLVTGNWVLGIADAVSYLPQSPTTGLSGVAGTGDLGASPINTGLEPVQNVLSGTNVSRVSNSLTGQAERRLSGATSLSATGSYGLIRYMGGPGLDTTQLNGQLSLNHRLNGRTSIFVNGGYGAFSYPMGGAFNTKSLNVGLERLVSRRLTLTASGGPLWVNTSSNLGIPQRMSVGVDIGGTYTIRNGSLTARYSRGVNGGSGVQPGALSDTFSGLGQKSFGRDWSGGINASFSRNQGLTQNAGAAISTIGLQDGLLLGNTTSTYAGAQVSRRFGQRFNGFFTYTALQQSISNGAAGDVDIIGRQYFLNGISNTFSIGVSFTPRSSHLGQL
jgi:hypothetical protein